jgi:transposase
MIAKQQTMVLSSYTDIYDIVVPKNHLLREINELVDFSFVYEELKDKYCHDNGRNAIDPIRMFKYLLLKNIYNLSDVDLVERSRYDMSFKYFLGMSPEETDLIDSSSLTKFRRNRLKDKNLLDLLINKTVEIAIEKGVLKSKTIIVDSTHTSSRYHPQSPKEILETRSKSLRKAVYSVDESLKSKFPEKNKTDNLEDEITYCQKLIEVIEKEETVCTYPKVKESLNLLKETVSDDLEHLATIQSSNDEDAKIGHKSADTDFFGYKSHLGMSEEGIITAGVITTGEKHDGKQLQPLIEKSIDAGVEVETVIGDTAYSLKDNKEFTNKNNIELISKLPPGITEGTRKKENEFEFNKDAGMYVCKAGHMAVRKRRTYTKKEGDNRNTVNTYYFDIEKCKICPFKDGCYRGGKTKSYSVRLLSDEHLEEVEFQESDYFKEKSKIRYKIEAKNSQLKNRHGLKKAISSGLFGMEIQAAVTIFAVNLKTIIKLMSAK